jgi:hypothetical protein
MLTFFTTARPFRGRDAIIQRNALTSWLRLHPSVQILLFGDAPGSMELAWELGIHFEPEVVGTAGALRLHEMFGKARQLARHRLLCYIDSRMLLLPDFCEAFNRVEALYPEFLMVGRRWDVDIAKPLDFEEHDWQNELRYRALVTGRCNAPQHIDYLTFSCGLFPRELPPLPLGSRLWSKWLLWKAIADGAMVVDASAVVLAVHQELEADGLGAPQRNPDDEQNGLPALCGGPRHLRSIDGAPYRLTASDIVPNRFRRIRNWCRREHRFVGQSAVLRQQNV